MEQEIILVATITVTILVIILIVFFSIFQSKKNKYLIEKREAERLFEEEVVKTQTEIKEQALKNFGWELHDNVGQLLSTARMQINILNLTIPDGMRESLEEVNELIGESLSQIRLLSKALNPEMISSLGLVESIRLELERFNRLKFLKADLNVHGEEIDIEERDIIIIFRILQEFFSNVIKHAKAQHLTVDLTYTNEALTIEAEDDGIGFGPENLKSGSGLLNMRSRAKMIGAECSIRSVKKQGARILLKYNLQAVAL
ncbi:sensor histidine kinase [Fulvivirga ligni]|uniref:sensor histidine kinase n=1 Tax=Fulvivirga ligni TaxID=2904246 RepID=UPI001F41FF77|nr:ATP-binding protein [Fulvivirga ligni]UII19356.1 histidine kinase [Fulvivirga ligni]